MEKIHKFSNAFHRAELWSLSGGARGGEMVPDVGSEIEHARVCGAKCTLEGQRRDFDAGDAWLNVRSAEEKSVVVPEEAEVVL